MLWPYFEHLIQLLNDEKDRERFAHSHEMSYFRNSSIMGKHENYHEKPLCKFIKTINYAHKYESTTKPTNIKQRKKKCLVTI